MVINVDLAKTWRYPGLGSKSFARYSNALQFERRNSWFVLLFTCLANTLDSLE